MFVKKFVSCQHFTGNSRLVQHSVHTEMAVQYLSKVGDVAGQFLCDLGAPQSGSQNQRCNPNVRCLYDPWTLRCV